MPHGNRRGPLAEGSMTGRGAGYCAGYDKPGYMKPLWRGGYRRGFGGSRNPGWKGGGGFGWHRGWGRRDPVSYPAAFGPLWNPLPFYGAPDRSRDTELSMLRDHATRVEGVLKEIRRRMSELEREEAKEA